MRLLGFVLFVLSFSLPVSAQDDNFTGEEVGITGSRLGGAKLSFSAGGLTDAELVFQNSNQGLLTQDRRFGEIELWVPIDLSLIAGWKTYLAGGITFEEMLQLNHFNIPSGAVGPSNGIITYRGINLGLGVERALGPNTDVTFDAGLGLGEYAVSGSFNADGTFTTFRFSANLWQKLTENIQAGPGLEMNYDLSGGAVAGGFGLGRQSATVSKWTLGVRMDF